MATKSAPKKHPPHVVARAAAEDGEVDPKEGVEFVTLETGIRIPMPDVNQRYHPMDLSANPAVVAGMPSYLIDEEAPLTVSPHTTTLMMLPNIPYEERVEQYKVARDAQTESLNAQIAVAQEALGLMQDVPDPPEPAHPEPVTDEQLMTPDEQATAHLEEQVALREGEEPPTESPYPIDYVAAERRAAGDNVEERYRVSKEEEKEQEKAAKAEEKHAKAKDEEKQSKAEVKSKDPEEKTDEALAEEREARGESEPGFPPPKE